MDASTSTKWSVLVAKSDTNTWLFTRMTRRTGELVTCMLHSLNLVQLIALTLARTNKTSTRANHFLLEVCDEELEARMTNESNMSVAAKKKALIGRQMRQSLVPKISGALDVPLESVRFTDELKTFELGVAFAEGMNNTEVRAFPNRTMALEFVHSRCQAFSGLGAWLVDDFHLTGAIEVDLVFALLHLDKLLRAQGEFVRLLSMDGMQGLCISSEEGKEEHHERHVVIWK